jgi:NAD(P)H-flavin reductase
LDGPFNDNKSNELSQLSELICLACGSGVAAMLPYIEKMLINGKKCCLVWSSNNEMDFKTSAFQGIRKII